MPELALTRPVLGVVLEQEVVLERLEAVEAERMLATLAHDLGASVGAFEQRAAFRTLLDVLEIEQQALRRRHVLARRRAARRRAAHDVDVVERQVVESSTCRRRVRTFCC